MPEYLSPGVYLEEVDTGSKPIEGVSTSTVGMVGVSERGPENIPILVTSNGEYKRIFGGELTLANFTDNIDRVHAYLPHSVQGFFQNRGQRNYVVRVLPEDSTRAQRFLFDRGDESSVDTILLRDAPRDTGSTVNQPLVYGISDGALTAGDWIRVGEGSRSEYKQLASDPDATPLHTSLAVPLNASYATGVDIASLVRVADATFAGSYTLAADIERGDTSILLDAIDASHAGELASASEPFVEIGTAGVAEYIQVERAVVTTGNQVEVLLRNPVQSDFNASENVTAIDISTLETSTSLTLSVNAGATLIYADTLLDDGEYPGGTASEDQLILIDDSAGTGNMELRRLSSVGGLNLDVGSYTDYPSSSRVQRVNMDDDMQTVSAAASDQVFDVTVIANFEVGMTIEVQNNSDLATIQQISATELTLVSALDAGVPSIADTVTAATRITSDAVVGSVVLALANRVGLEVGDVLRIGNAPNEEYITIARIVGSRGVAPDAGNVVLSLPLKESYQTDTIVVHQLDPVVDASQPVAYTIIRADENSTRLRVNDSQSYLVAPAGFRENDVVVISTPSGISSYHRLSADAIDLTTFSLELTEAFDFSHEIGSTLVGREPLISVQALDRGDWGNRLRVAIADSETSLVQAQLTSINAPQIISLSNYTGVEAGTVLEFFHPETQQVIGAPLKVLGLDRASGEIELDGTGLNATHTNGFNDALLAGVSLQVRSREFDFSVFLLHRPDPATPSRNNNVMDSERFLVSMDPRHSLYIHTVIGTTWIDGQDFDQDDNPLRLWDRRSEGGSNYVRVRDIDVGNDAQLESIRLGPEALIDELDSGQIQAARLPLESGDDAFISINNQAQGDAIYIGSNSDEPNERTGIHALRNIQDISVVSVPGQTTTGVQQTLINHCENDRYRFAVLDAHGPNNDTLVDVQTQRQSFDSKYAAIYYPWLTITEPLPTNVTNIRQLPIPPSGHMMGIYARTDNTRGVHKAPANEVVRGIIGLTRDLNKREHDILNPFPRNINVIRNFRDSNRGLRVWGARCITSDSDYKYVNVRRLMIFLEASIDRGLQWVVFEPNAQPLWSRVRRSITNFLNIVWRNGALEGTKAEQAFYVKCDRTTMTQTDIDNGRLICEIGVAPVKPAEFVIVRIGLSALSTD